MNLLSCDLCFDIGNPIMDNLGGHIPNFYGFQAASRVEHCLAPVPKEIFPPSFPFSEPPQKNYWGTDQLSPKSGFFFNRSFMGNCLWGAAGAFFFVFSGAFSGDFSPYSPPQKILPLLPPVCQEHQNISSPPSASSPDLEAGQEINFPQTILLVQSQNPLASLLCAESHTAKRPPPSDLFIANHWDFLMKNTLKPLHDLF